MCWPPNKFKHSLANGVQNITIHKTALDKGDVGIARHYEVSPEEGYRLTARVRIREKTGSIKARVNMAARKKEGPRIKEFNEAWEENTAGPVEVVCREARMPPGTSSSRPG